MIVLRLDGGLGNQLFQFAYAVALQGSRGGRLVLDSRLVERNPVWANALAEIVDLPSPRGLDKVVATALRIYAGVGIRVVRRLCGPTDRAALHLARFGVHHPFDTRHVDFGHTRTPFLYIHGKYMSQKYFISATARVRSLIRPERALSAKGREMVERIRSSNAVAVHIRRGDYLSDRWRTKLHICTEDYYREGITTIREQVTTPVFYIFTTSREDAQWVRENYSFLPERKVFVPESSSDVEHFALMAACRHFIISNSTFSWWASYLSEADGKIVVAPTPWNRNAWDMQDIYLPEWKLVKIDVDKDAT